MQPTLASTIGGALDRRIAHQDLRVLDTAGTRVLPSALRQSDEDRRSRVVKLLAMLSGLFPTSVLRCKHDGCLALEPPPSQVHEPTTLDRAGELLQASTGETQLTAHLVFAAACEPSSVSETYLETTSTVKA